MLVKDLIAQLETEDPEAEVYVSLYNKEAIMDDQEGTVYGFSLLSTSSAKYVFLRTKEPSLNKVLKWNL